MEFCPKWAQKATHVRRVKQQRELGELPSITRGICAWHLGSGTQRYHEPRREASVQGQGEVRWHKRALSAECHQTRELCAGSDLSWGESSWLCRAGHSPLAAPSSCPLGTGREQGEKEFCTLLAASCAGIQVQFMYKTDRSSCVKVKRVGINWHKCGVNRVVI